jgi:hypothetical protein
LRKSLLIMTAITGLAAVTAYAQEAPLPAIPKGSWELLTTTQPYPHLWGVFPTSDACAAGQKQLHMTAVNSLASMRGVTPDEFTDSVNRLHSLEAANCVQN